MESFDRIKNILHDLKTPLTSILGYTELLRGNRDKKTVEKFLSIIEFEGNRALEMIDSFIRSDFLESSDAVDCEEIVSSVCKEFEPMARDKDIKILVHCDEKCEVVFNRIELWRVISNIVGNAIKYNKIGGFLDISIQKNQNFVTFEFSDSGIGMTPEELSNIFKKGFRGNVGSKISGHGYGLYNVREIVTINGGTIKVESEKNIGTKFTLNLRCAE